MPFTGPIIIRVNSNTIARLTRNNTSACQPKNWPRSAISCCLLPARENHGTRGLHHLGIGTGKGFQTRGSGGIRPAVTALQLRQIVQILMQRLIQLIVWQYAGVGVEHFAVAFALALVHHGKGWIVKHAILAVAALHLQRYVGHSLAAARIDKRRTVG